MVYPRLCQSMMILDPRSLLHVQTIAKVGILGGFFLKASVEYPSRGRVQRFTDLDHDELWTVWKV
jgi:hypothetical protein